MITLADHERHWAKGRRARAYISAAGVANLTMVVAELLTWHTWWIWVALPLNAASGLGCVISSAYSVRQERRRLKALIER